MDRIFLITSAAVGFVVGAVYAAIAKMVVQTAKAVVRANQQIVQAEKARTEGRQQQRHHAEKAPDKVKLPARVK